MLFLWIFFARRFPVTVSNTNVLQTSKFILFEWVAGISDWVLSPVTQLQNKLQIPAIDWKIIGI